MFCEQLAVHVGVSGLATSVTLEQCGHNKGYKRLDNHSFHPASQCCIENGPDCITSVIDMEKVCNKVNSSNIGITVSVSRDAGRQVIHVTHFFKKNSEKLFDNCCFGSCDFSYLVD